MRRLFVIATIILFVFIATAAYTDETTFSQLERKYIEQYGEPSAKIRLYSEELNFDYRSYRWDDIGIMVVFVRYIKLSGHNQWFVYAILGRCPDCGKYHIKLPMV